MKMTGLPGDALPNQQWPCRPFLDACVCPRDSKVKYSVFYNICVLMFMYYTVCCFTGVLYAVERHISVLFTDIKDAVFCSVKIIMTRKVDKAIRPV